jgi:heme/copper-type cytochrome/quinol oxidase subunit 2
MKSLLKFSLLILAAFAPSKLLACATCGGAHVDSPMAQGMNWGIFTLMAVIGTVLGGFLTFLIYAIRKSEALEAEAQKKAQAHSHSPESPKI